MWLCGKSVRSWYYKSSDRSFMVDPLSYFSFQPVPHNWCNKGCFMCYPVCGMVHIKEHVLLIRKCNYVAAAGFLSCFLLSEWSFTIYGGGRGGTNIPLRPNQKSGGAHAPLPPPPRLPTPVYIYMCVCVYIYV